VLKLFDLPRDGGLLIQERLERGHEAEGECKDAI
jgi:hypothetical protein